MYNPMSAAAMLRIERRVVLRAEAFRVNSEGWALRLKNLERHVGSTP